MDWLLEPAWRVYLAGLLIVAGIAIFGVGIRRSAQWRRVRANDGEKPIALASAIRILIFGMCLFGLGVGWVGQWTWVVIFAAIFLGEEVLETSIVVSALKDGERLKARQARRKVAASSPNH